MPQQRTNARGTLIVQTCFCNFRNWGRPIKVDFHIYGISFPRATVKECSDCHHAPSYAHRTCSPRRELASNFFPQCASVSTATCSNEWRRTACLYDRRSVLAQTGNLRRTRSMQKKRRSKPVEKLFAFSSFGKLKGASHNIIFAVLRSSYFMHVWLCIWEYSWSVAEIKEKATALWYIAIFWAEGINDSYCSDRLAAKSTRLKSLQRWCDNLPW